MTDNFASFKGKPARVKGYTQEPVRQ